MQTLGARRSPCPNQPGSGERVKTLETRIKAGHQRIDPLISQFRNPENRARAEKLKSVFDQYFAGAKEMRLSKPRRSICNPALRLLTLRPASPTSTRRPFGSRASGRCRWSMRWKS